MSFIKRKISNFKAKVIPTRELKHFLFGQQHCGNHPFFVDLYGQSHSVHLFQMPHYLFLEKHIDDPHSDNIYARYLQNSWNYLFPDDNIPNKIVKKIDDYVQLYNQIAAHKHLAHKAFEKPISVCRRPDGKVIIIHGNHRASIALKLGLDIKAVFVDPGKHLKKISYVKDEFYGSARLGIPYQSIFQGEKEVVKGRRPDILRRIKTIDPNDLRDKTLIDFGCNIGCNCFLAVHFGVTNVTGIDYSPRLISVATRLNSYFTMPCSFIVHDLNHEIPDIKPADTVFCFSVAKHLQDPQAMYRAILNKTKRVLYFEGHAGTQQSDYEQLLNKDNFKAIDMIGYMYNDLHKSKKATRPLFRCEISK